MSRDLSSVLSTFAAAFTQQNRLLRLRFAPGSGLPEDALLPQRIDARESLSECYQLKVECLSSDTHLELKDFLGQAVDIAILLGDGGERILSGIVTQTEYRGSDGGFTQFMLQIEPALAPLAHRLNSRVLQDKSVPEIVALILDEHIQNSPAFAQTFRHRAQLENIYPQRSYCVQYRESDLAFIQRLLREEGISYYFDFTHPEAEIGLHTLVLFDDVYNLEANTQDRIRFHRSDATESDDTLTSWNSRRNIQSSVVALASYDYKPAASLSGRDISYIDQGDAGLSLGSTLESYDAKTLYYGENSNDMARYATLRQQALDLKSKLFVGAGSTRSLSPGTWFQLADHPLHDQDAIEQRQFVVLAQQWQAENNLPGELKSFSPSPRAGEGRGEGEIFHTAFQAIRRGIPLVPEYTKDHARPTAHGIQTALVVGPDDEEIYTDAMGRIKIQMHWQRPRDHAPNRTGSSAHFDDQSSCWVRVVDQSAGANWGTQHIPRIGQEVVIDFIEGDIDRPLCTGVLHNGRQLPSTFSNAGSLPNNKTLSGLKTKEYKSSGYNELILDDSTNQLRARLSSEHAKTQLNQGYLIHPRTEGKGEPRSEGLELRTDAAGAIRAPMGLLLSADARRSATGKQLDRQELLSQLEAAYHQANTQADHAAHQNANQTETGKDKQQIDGASQAGKQKTSGHQAHLKDAIENLARGTNTDKDKKTGKGDQAGQQGALMMSAPNGIALVTPNSLSLVTGANLDQIAGRDTNQSTGRRWIHNSGESISLFVAGSKAKLKETIKLIASKGKVQIQAQSDAIEITGDQSLALTSVNDQILVNAKEHITFAVGGGSYFKLQGGNIEVVCPGNMTVKAGDFSLMGPTRMRAPLPLMPGWVPAIEPNRALKSTYALDQLTLVAKQSSRPEFVAFVMPIFGTEIPPEVYFKLQDALVAGKIKNPEIEVFNGAVAGHIAAFDQESRKILVSSGVADQAPKTREESWLLMAALLEEFGHYIDVVLRNDLSDIAGDAKEDEGAFFAYRISHIDFAGTSETEYAQYKAPKYTGPLKVKYPEFQAGISKWVNKASIADDQKQGSLEFFGAGRGENFKKNPHGSFGHESIEDVLVRADFRDDKERKQIYFGNWLRDFSQMVDPAFTRKEGSPPNFPFMTRKAMTELVKIKASLEFVQVAGDTKLYQLDTSLLGVYRPVEHIDNPKNFKPGNPRSIDPDFADPVPPGSPLLQIDPATSMKRYIVKSADFMAEQLRLAVARKRTPEGFRHFGAALHVLEDYFAHSNFVELALRKVGYSKILAWTSAANCKHKYPIVTGMFDSEDVVASTAGVIAELLFPVEWEFKRLKPGERTPSDKTTLILLGEHEDKRYLDGFNTYLKLRDVKLSVPGSEYIDMALHYTVGMHANATNFLFSSLVHLVGNSVDDAQTTLKSDPNTNGSSDPTHSQLAKDHDNHAFHTLAAGLAKIAVLEVGKAMRDAWSGVTNADPVKVARTFIVHPNDASWVDSEVMRWARANPSNLKRGESNTEWQALRAEHEKEVREKIQQTQARSQQFWEYNNKHYQTLFRDKNQVKK